MPSIIDSVTTPAATNNTTTDSSIANIETATPAATGVATYKPTEVQDPSEWTVEPDQTVAGQLNTIVDPNNPLMVKAKARAQQQSADRGLINSSIAATAGESAMLDAAMPIAQADAAARAKAAGYNVDIKNQTNVTNANAQNSADQFNTGQMNQQALQKAQQESSKVLQQMQQDSNMAVEKMQQDSNMAVQQMSKDNERLLAVNSKAGEMMSNATSAINNIMNNNQMDQSTKTENMRQITNNLKAQLSILSKVQSLDLGSLLINPYG